jgi:acyl carrier protein
MSDDPAGPIRRFVAAHYPAAAIGDDEDIFALGLANSLFAMELVMFIEKTFALSIPNEELRLDNFRSVEAMATVVERLATIDTPSVR